MIDTKLRGVNLGGWLVLEKWITPSLFKGTSAKDEYSLMQESGAAKKVEKHRRSFITEADFRWLVENGVSAVRIPVGYWVFDGDAPYTACVDYLDWAMEMAEKYQLKVLIDLHGAKGSQNGKHHSGRIGQAGWYQNKDYRLDTIDTLKRIATRYHDSLALWGIQVINEPSLGPVQYFKLLSFYKKAYGELVNVARPGVRIVFSDGFVPWLMTGALRQSKSHPAVMDVHWYQFGKTNLEKYFSRLARRSREIRCLERQQEVIVGEWSGVISHLNLEGVRGSRRAVLDKRHIKEQLAAYQAATGWFYWTYKTESGGIWSFKEQVEKGRLLLDKQR